MTLQPITSSMLSAIGYNADTLTLFVQFHPSKKQQAAGVAGEIRAYKNYVHGLPKEQPPEGWGRWFLANIRGKYTGEVVVPEAAHPETLNGNPVTPVDGLVEEEW